MSEATETNEGGIISPPRRVRLDARDFPLIRPSAADRARTLRRLQEAADWYQPAGSMEEEQ